MLAIGDGTRTDVAGAMGEGIDSLYITGGLARAETKTQRQPDPQALERWLAAEGVSPPYAIGALRGRERTAERILEHAGREDPSMDDVRPDKSASAAATAGSASDGDGEGQASLGDFR